MREGSGAYPSRERREKWKGKGGVDNSQKMTNNF